MMCVVFTGHTPVLWGCEQAHVVYLHTRVGPCVCLCVACMCRCVVRLLPTYACVQVPGQRPGDHHFFPSPAPILRPGSHPVGAAVEAGGPLATQDAQEWAEHPAQ